MNYEAIKDYNKTIIKPIKTKIKTKLKTTIKTITNHES